MSRRRAKAKDSWALRLYREIQEEKKDWPSWMHDHLEQLREYQAKQRARREALQKSGRRSSET